MLDRVALCRSCQQPVNADSPMRKLKFLPIAGDEAGQYLICPCCGRRNIVVSVAPNRLRIVGLRAA